MIMKLQKIVCLQILALASTCYASDPTALLNKTNALNAAKNALSAVLGTGGTDNNGTPPPTADQIALVHKNSTTIPVVISMALGDVVVRQSVLAGGTYSQNAYPKDMIGFGVHADLSPLFANYDPQATYNIVINANGDLALQRQDAGTTVPFIINKTGWQMALNFDLKDNDSDATILSNDQRYTHKKDALSVTITPLIEDVGQPVAVAKAWTIENSNGDFVLK
jgi:hypothetical protein